MFDDFANVWTIVGVGRDLKSGIPLALQVAGEAVVLFRDEEGKAVALIDRCPHRGVRLSLGTVVVGELECPFHGWRFNGRGENCAVPWNPDAKRENLGATALPLREIDGLLWLYTGFAPEAEPEPSESFDLPGVTVCAQSMVWNIHWTRAMENMLDSPHLPFVHRRTIGAELRPLAGGRMDVSWEERAYGARIRSSVDGAPRPGALDYRFPNCMELFIDPRGRLLRLMVVCLPVDQGKTRLILFTLRDFARPRLFDPLFRWMNGRIAREDQAIVESSQPAMVPPPAEEASVASDVATLAFRRIYRHRLLGSVARRQSTMVS